MSIDTNCVKCNEIKIYFYKTDNGIIPTKKYDNDAGWDLYSTETFELLPFQRKVIDFKVGIAKHEKTHWNFVGIIKTRSSMGLKGLEVSNAGVIDMDYTGTIRAIFINNSNLPIKIDENDRIAQIVFLPIPYITILESDNIDNDNKKRGSNGFGSTGK